jgi:hypothetical protein
MTTRTLKRLERRGSKMFSRAEPNLSRPERYCDLMVCIMDAQRAKEHAQSKGAKRKGR